MRIARTLIVLGAFLVPGIGLAGPAGSAIAEYLGVPEQIRSSLEQLITRLEPENARAAEVIRKSSKYMYREEVVAKAAAIFEGQLTSEEIQTFTAFMATPLGQRLRQTFRSNLTHESFETGLAAYPESDIHELNRFLTSPAATKVFSTLPSAEWQKPWRAYGELMTCRYFEQEQPRLLLTVRQRGKCVGLAY